MRAVSTREVNIMKKLHLTTFFIGLWLAGSPWELGIVHAGIAPLEAVFVGLLIATVSFFQLLCRGKKVQIGLSVTMMVLGLCALAAPFILGYSGLTAALWNDLVFGAIVLAFAAYELVRPFFQSAENQEGQRHSAL